MTYKMYNPYSHLTEARELTPEQGERIKAQLTAADLDDIENGGRVKVGAAAKVWKVDSPTANHDAPGVAWAEADARRQDKGESLGAPWK